VLCTRFVSPIQKDWRELGGSIFGMVHVKRDEISFQVRAFAFARFFVATQAPLVRFCTNH
jgi:hypothetical protein